MILESVPNLSCGPASPLLERVTEALEAESSPGWALLDRHSDPDHNRTVLTLAGAPVPLLRVLGTLVETVDAHGSLVGHEGVHPRVGVIDVLPVVPLDGAGAHDAERVARQLVARLVARRVPVYRYGAFATAPDRARLASIRSRVRFFGRSETPELLPDDGPEHLHERLGATCVGVRRPLVAYNVLLDTTDKQVGDRIARALRPGEGGLVGVQALAFRLASRGDRVQVSTNLTRPDEVGCADVFAQVRALATEEGVDVVEGELVGLAPEASLPTDPEQMGLEQRPGSLEARLRAAGLGP